jgi:exodeoxyribonuclease-1
MASLLFLLFMRQRCFGSHSADVEATIFMAKLIRNSAPELWSAMIALASKSKALARLNNCEPVALSEFYGGRAYNWPVVGCGCAPEADSLGCVFDLRFDPEDFLQLSEDQLVSVIRSPRKALRYVAANKQPILLPIDFVRDGRCGIDAKDDLIFRRANIIANEDGFRRRACRALAKRFEKEGEPAQCVEERIYDQFPSASDAQLMRKFHRVPWQARIPLLDQLGDDRFRELGYRLIHIEQPYILTETKRLQLDVWLHKRLHGPSRLPNRMLVDAIKESERLMAVSEINSQSLMAETNQWLKNWRRSVTADFSDPGKAA